MAKGHPIDSHGEIQQGLYPLSRDHKVFGIYDTSKFSKVFVDVSDQYAI